MGVAAPAPVLVLDVAARTPKGPPAAPAVVGMSMEWSGATVLLRSPGFVQMLSNPLTLTALVPVRRPHWWKLSDTTWWDPNGTKPFDTSCAASYSGQVCVKYAVDRLTSTCTRRRSQCEQLGGL